MGKGEKMKFKTAAMEDFETVFHYIQALWTYNTYDKEEIRRVYERVIRDENSFAFFVLDEGEYKGFCHGLWKAFHKRCYAKLIVMQRKFLFYRKQGLFSSFNLA